MNRQSIHQQIDSLLKIISDQHEHIKNHHASIPQVEIDFMVQNLRQLFEAGLMLNHTNALTSLDEVKAAVTQKILAEKRAAEMKQTTPAEVKEVVEKTPEAHAVNHPVDELIAAVGSAAPGESEKSEKPKSRKNTFDLNMRFEDKPTVGDKFGNEESLHTKIASATSKKTIAEKLHLKPITDLKAAIGINEKFLFVNRLFDGNLQDYSAAVEKINAASDISSAKQIVADLTRQLNWDAASEQVRNFVDLVDRRFSTATSEQGS